MSAAKPLKKPALDATHKLLYGRDEAAFALGISLRSIDTMIADRRLRTRRFGRRVLIPATDVAHMATRIIGSDMLEGVTTGKSVAA